MNKISQLLGAVAVVAIIVVFVLQFRPASGARTQSEGARCVAEVHGTCIQTHVFQAAVRALSMSGQRVPQLKTFAAEGLVEAQLLNEDAKRLGVAVSDDDVSREFVAGRLHLSLPVKQNQLAANLNFGGYQATKGDMTAWFQLIPVKNKDKKFEQKQFEKMVRRFTSLSSADFRDWQTKELVAARMRDLVRARVRVGEDEVFEQFSHDKSTATIDFVKFGYDWYTELIDASPKKVEEWTEKNKELLDKTWDARKNSYLPECRVARHILVKLDQTTSTDEEKAAAKKKMDAAVERIKKGEDFGAVAREISDDPGSAIKGGELGCVPKGQTVKPFEDALFGLAAPGAMSEVVASQFGLHVIKVEQIVAGPDAEKVGRTLVAKELFQKTEASRLAAEGAKQVLAAVRSGKTLKEATAAYVAGVTAKKTEDQGDAKKDDAKGDEPKKKKKKGDKDKDDKAEGDKDKPKAPGAAESDARPQVETSLPFTANGEAIPGARGPNEVAKIAFNLKNPGDLPDDVIAYDGGFAVVQLKEKTPATKEEFAKNRDDYMFIFRRDKGQEALFLYVKRLAANLDAAAKPNPELVREEKPGDKSAPQDEPMPMDDGE